MEGASKFSSRKREAPWPWLVLNFGGNVPDSRIVLADQPIPKKRHQRISLFNTVIVRIFAFAFAGKRLLMISPLPSPIPFFVDKPGFPRPKPSDQSQHFRDGLYIHIHNNTARCLQSK